MPWARYISEVQTPGRGSNDLKIIPPSPTITTPPPPRLLAKTLPDLTAGIQSTAICPKYCSQSDRTHNRFWYFVRLEFPMTHWAAHTRRCLRVPYLRQRIHTWTLLGRWPVYIFSFSKAKLRDPLDTGDENSMILPKRRQTQVDAV